MGMAQFPRLDLAMQTLVEGEPFTVVGIYESRNAIENGALILPLHELQRIMDRAGKVTGFSLVLDGPQDSHSERVEDLRVPVVQLGQRRVLATGDSLEDCAIVPHPSRGCSHRGKYGEQAVHEFFL